MHRSPRDSEDREVAALRRLTGFKTFGRAPKLIGESAIGLFHQQQAKRSVKLDKVIELWRLHVPQLLVDHTELSGFSRGTLGVTVSGSAKLYELKMLMLAGLEKQLIFAGRGCGLRKITLKLGGE